MSDQPRKISNFHLTRLVYEGGKSEIYEARYAQPGGAVHNAAVKLLRPKMAWIGDELRAFLRELGWARDLRSPIAPRVIEAGERDGNYFLAMELVDGWTLAELLRSLAVLQVPLPSQIGLSIAHRIAEGVHAMHEFSEGGECLGVVHLGIQPENILLSKMGATMLVDFGTTTSASSGEIVDLDERGGAYQAPERLRMLPIDRRADIYSLGRVLNDLAHCMSPQDRGSDLPALIGRACHVHAEERFPSMADVVVALELVARNRGVEISAAACGSFASEIFGSSEGRRDSRSARPPSVAPFVMQSEGLETAFAPPEQESEDRNAVQRRKFQTQPTMLGGETPGLGATVMGGPDAMSTVPADSSGMETVMGGPDAMPGERSSNQESADSRFGEPQFGNEEPTEETLAPIKKSAAGQRKRFVDDHQAVTVMGAPQMLQDLAGSEETTAVLEAEARAAKGFPEELIPTRTYSTDPDEDESENETVLGGDLDS